MMWSDCLPPKVFVIAGATEDTILPTGDAPFKAERIESLSRKMAFFRCRGTKICDSCAWRVGQSVGAASSGAVDDLVRTKNTLISAREP